MRQALWPTLSNKSKNLKSKFIEHTAAKYIFDPWSYPNPWIPKPPSPKSLISQHCCSYEWNHGSMSITSYLSQSTNILIVRDLFQPRINNIKPNELLITILTETECFLLHVSQSILSTTSPLFDRCWLTLVVACATFSCSTTSRSSLSNLNEFHWLHTCQSVWCLHLPQC